MKKEDLDHNTISNKLNKNLDEDNIENPELLKVKFTTKYFVEKQQEPYKIGIPKKSVINNSSLDAKIKHRKKREGD